VLHFSTFTGPVSQTLWGFRADTLNNPIVPDAELNWLRDNPQQVARIRRLEVLLDDELNLIVPTFVFSLRFLDPRVAEGFRLATVYLPGAAPYNFDADVSLDEHWPSAEGRPKEENDFVLTALNEAARTGELWAGTILRSIVLPDTSGLDPEDWGLDFTPFQSRT
jgi:hypothetical protein